jgi:hypothetical protein
LGNVLDMTDNAGIDAVTVERTTPLAIAPPGTGA